MDGLDYIAGESTSEKSRKRKSDRRDTLSKALVLAAAAAVAEHATGDEAAKLEPATEHTLPDPVPEVSTQPEADADPSNPDGQEQASNSHFGKITLVSESYR